MGKFAVNTYNFNYGKTVRTFTIIKAKQNFTLSSKKNFQSWRKKNYSNNLLFITQIFSYNFHRTTLTSCTKKKR